jgi:hypothetical protein
VVPPTTVGREIPLSIGFTVTLVIAIPLVWLTRVSTGQGNISATDPRAWSADVPSGEGDIDLA